MTKLIPGIDECLRGKVAVVSGAARGIGRATAIAFAREGANIVGIDISAPVDTRSGVEAATPDESAALELGPHGITVNAVVPGLIDTPLTRHKERYAQALQAAGKMPTGSSTDEEEARKVLTAKTPLGVPWIEPEDVAPVVVFLASEAARMVSGATYDVTGRDSANNTA